MTVVSMIFNCAVIVNVTFSKDLNQRICILFGNLAISDFLVSLSAFYIALLFIIEPYSTIAGSRDILIAYVPYTTSILSTIYNLVCIGIERYMTVSGNTTFKSRVTKTHILSAVLFNWVVAIILGSLPLMGWDCSIQRGTVSTLYGPFCIDYLAFITIPNCAIGFILLLISYIGIILILRKQKFCMLAHGQFNGTFKAAEEQVAKTCIFIWILAVVSYSPFFGGVLWDVFNTICPENLHTGVFVFRNFSAMMITLNSLGNPIIYTFKFKTIWKKFVFCKCQSSNRVSVQDLVNATSTKPQ
ncbi:lysophosphatidic acid receptor 1-A-like [Bombina bombina]|uniref:lysophosphatidic acid receptor 1-A-like n=1 Tax=Bombina bombina TaxID=8345 RepID=UPI00235B17FB|nr:lysophosphatidic acid receptor 1-A-like [Bombina bombina]